MNILFTGSAGLIREWLDVCSDHACIVYSRGVKKKFEDDVMKVHALDEAPPIDLIVDLHVRESKKRRLILADIIAEINGDAPILCNAIGTTVTELAAKVGMPARMVGVAALPGLLASEQVEISFPYASDRALLEPVRAFFEGLGKSVQVVRDEVGMVTPRVLAVMINEAVLLCQQDIVTEKDVDALLAQATQGDGPIAWGRRIGWRNLYILLSALHDELGSERYRPASLLKKLALSE